MCLQYFHNSVAERTESSDSGVDANSVSSCELGNLQQEMPRDLFNKQLCVDYLQNGKWISSILFIFSISSQHLKVPASLPFTNEAPTPFPPKKVSWGS